MIELGNQVLESCKSTNDLARELGEKGAPSGTWISSRIQEAGRGRMGRNWSSIEGNLFLSMVVRIEPSDFARWGTWVPLVTAVALVDVLKAMYPEARVGIKWPNDLWIDGKKLCGILCEGIGARGGSFIVVGLGLNCADSPKDLDQPTISLSEALMRSVTADDIRASVVAGMRSAFEELRAQGPRSFYDRYQEYSVIRIGSGIAWLKGGNEVSGKVLGLGSSGELKVMTSDGAELSLYAEDVKIRLGDQGRSSKSR